MKTLKKFLLLLLLSSLIGNFFWWIQNSFAADTNLIYDTNTNLNQFWETFLPFDYRPYFPTDDTKVAYNWITDATSAINTDWTDSHLYNILNFNNLWVRWSWAWDYTPSVTPWYSPQSYLIFPKEFNWNYWNITLTIDNFIYQRDLWNKLRPWVSITYYDENNSIILTAFDSGWDLFNPWDYISAWYQPIQNNTFYGQYSNDIWVWEPKTCGSWITDSDNAWCKIKNQPGSTERWIYRLNILLPLERFSDRTKNIDYDWELAWENVPLSKLKYIKIKIWLSSLIDETTDESYLKCWAFRSDTLSSDLSGTKIQTNSIYDYWFSLTEWNSEVPWNYVSLLWPDDKKVEDVDLLSIWDWQIFRNWTKYTINNPLTYMWFYKWEVYPSDTWIYKKDEQKSLSSQFKEMLTHVLYNPSTEEITNWDPLEESDLKSRRVLQNQLAVRMNDLNVSMKDASRFPSEVKVNWVSRKIRIPLSLDLSSIPTYISDKLKASNLSTYSWISELFKPQILTIENLSNWEVKLKLIENTGSIKKLQVNSSTWKIELWTTNYDTPVTEYDEIEQIIEQLWAIYSVNNLRNIYFIDWVEDYVDLLNQRVDKKLFLESAILPYSLFLDLFDSDLNIQNNALSTIKGNDLLSELDSHNYIYWYNYKKYEELDWSDPVVWRYERKISWTDITSSNFEILYNSLVFRSPFALEDCTKLYISNKNNQKDKYWRPSIMTSEDRVENDQDWINCNSFTNWVCSWSSATWKDKYEFVNYSSGQWFSYSPLWSEENFDWYYTTWINQDRYEVSYFTYLFWFKNIESASFQDYPWQKEIVQELWVPLLVWGSPYYDWKEWGPIISTITNESPWEIEWKVEIVKEKIKTYCTKLFEKDELNGLDEPTELGKINKCVSIHNPLGDSYDPNSSIYNPIYDLSLYFDSIFNENPKIRKSLETNFLEKISLSKWLDSKYYTDFSKIFNTLFLDDHSTLNTDWVYEVSSNSVYKNGIWEYIYFNTFLSSIPYSINKELELTLNTSGERVEKVDQSFSWQTIYPFDNELDYTYNLTWTPGTRVFWYNLTIPKWERYLKLGSYDLDKKSQLDKPWKPPLDISFYIRSAYENFEVPKNSNERIKHWPPIIIIDWKFSWGQVDSKILAWETTFYDTDKWTYISKSQSLVTWWNTGSFQVYNHWYTDLESWETSAPAYILPWPEWNDQTSFYKIDLWALKEYLLQDYQANWNDADTKYLKDWIFDPTTKRLKDNIILRFVVKNPDSSDDENILYLMNNWLIWSIPSNIELEYFSPTIELLDNSKYINWNNSSWVSQSLYTPLETDDSNTLKSTWWDTDLVSFRIYADTWNADLSKTRKIKKPVLLEDDKINLETSDFTTDEITQIEKIIPTEKELALWVDEWYFSIRDETTWDLKYKDYDNLGKGTISWDEKSININWKDFEKKCVLEDLDENYNVLLEDWTTNVSRVKPKQYVCYYVNSVIDITNIDNQVLELLDTTYQDKLPFVDIYLKYTPTSTRTIVDKSNQILSILWGTTTDYVATTWIPLSTEIYGNRVLKSYDDLSSSTNKPIIVWLKDFLSWKSIIDRFVENTLTTWIDDKSSRLDLFLYWSKTISNWVEEDYWLLSEDIKMNNQATSIFYDLDTVKWGGLCRDPSCLKVTWDYLKINDENNDAVRKQDADWNPVEPTWEIWIWDNVIVYPKVINEWAPICDLYIESNLTDWITEVDNWDNQLISMSSTYSDSTQTFNTNDSIWVDWIIKKDLVDSKDFKYRYTINDDLNKFSYKVNYRYCDETDYRTPRESYPISFKTDEVSTEFWSWLCHLNDTTPVDWTKLNQWEEIIYNITCTNIESVDIYDLQVKLPTDDYTLYKSWIKEDYIPLWSLAAWETISYQTNPLDLVKKVTILDNDNQNTLGLIPPSNWQKIEWILDYKYKFSEVSSTYEEWRDVITHEVETPVEDKVITTVLRWSCDNQNEYSYNNSWVQQYPYVPLQWMCVSKLPSDDSAWNLSYTEDNKACLVVRYYRLNEDPDANDTVDKNAYPNLVFWQGTIINWTTNNLSFRSSTTWGWYYSWRNDSGGGTRRYYLDNQSCMNSNSISNTRYWDWKEWAVRWKYVNVNVNMTVELPNSFETDWTAKVYSSFDNTPSISSGGTNSPVNLNNIKSYNISFWNQTWVTSQSEVNSSTFQQVLRWWDSAINSDWSIINWNWLEEYLVELRIPLKAISKGSDSTTTNTNFEWETVWDSQTIKVKDSQITFERQRWLAKDQNVQCLREVSSSWGRSWETSWASRTRYKFNKYNDNSTNDVSISTTTSQSFIPASEDEVPVCVSSDWKWIQVLNGWMYSSDLSNLKDIEHQIDLTNPASFNTNWFFNQDEDTILPWGFIQHNWWDDNIINLDDKSTTTMCYEYDSSTNSYNYNSEYSPDENWGICRDWTYPWFYAIRKWLYWYLYEFNREQLKDLMLTWLDLEKDVDWWTNIKDRVWLYEQKAHSWDELIFWRNSVDNVNISWLWSIFVTNDLDSLDDKSAVVNVNSNITYSSNDITTWETFEDVTWDSMAVVINWNLKIWSKVEKMEGVYFVDWDVIIEESRNMLEIWVLYATWDIIIKRKATTNSQIDLYTDSQDRPVFRVTWDNKRYMILQPKILQESTWYYKELIVDPNDLNFDCKVHWICE